MSLQGGAERPNRRGAQAARPRKKADGDGPAATGAGSAEFEALLEYLRTSRGFDFQGYKRASLLRRVTRRMQAVGATEFGAYVDRLEVDPDEFPRLFDTVLINVTGFFRDGQVWDELLANVAPLVLPRRAAGRPLRVWSAGCASGEEAYSLAMALAELMGLEAFCALTKLYATDLDEGALNQARLATYAEKEVANVPPALLEKYFERAGPKYVVKKDLRRCVIFGRHNLIQDAPISRIDLLSCRNVLMYFNAETQANVLSRFHFALNDEGVLFLGKAEMLLTHGHLFAPLDLKRRIFAKVSRGLPRERGPAPGGLPRVVRPAPDQRRLCDAAFELSPVVQLVLGASGELAIANERARALFGLGRDDLGRPLRELGALARVEGVRSSLERAASDHGPVALRDVEWSGETGMAFDVHVLPLVEGDARAGTGLTFVDVTAQRRLQNDLSRVNQELAATYEELQSTSEELETTNEELQSTNEELETTNEELQSTNEELETMNEELQSTNEELQSMNRELRHHGDELDRVNAFFRAILSGLHVGVVVLDHDLLVREWNHRAEDLWGLRRDEALGKHLLSLDIGLPVERLKGLLKSLLAGDVEFHNVTLDATNRRGKPLACKVTCTSLSPEGGDARGAILVMEEQPPAAAEVPS